MHRCMLWEDHLVAERGLHQYLCWMHPPPQWITVQGSGRCRMGAEVNLSLSSWKADRAVGVHTRCCWPFLNIDVNGASVVLKLLNEPSIEVSKAKEALQFLDSEWSWPVNDGLHLPLVHGYPSWADHIPEEGYSVSLKLTLLGLGI